MMIRPQNYKKYNDTQHPCVSQTFADVTKAVSATIIDVSATIIDVSATIIDVPATIIDYI